MLDLRRWMPEMVPRGANLHETLAYLEAVTEFAPNRLQETMLQVPQEYVAMYLSLQPPPDDFGQVAVPLWPAPSVSAPVPPQGWAPFDPGRMPIWAYEAQIVQAFVAGIRGADAVISDVVAQKEPTLLKAGEMRFVQYVTAVKKAFAAAGYVPSNSGPSVERHARWAALWHLHQVSFRRIAESEGVEVPSVQEAVHDLLSATGIVARKPTPGRPRRTTHF